MVDYVPWKKRIEGNNMIVLLATLLVNPLWIIALFIYIGWNCIANIGNYSDEGEYDEAEL